METSVLVALVTAIASIIVATFSLISNYLNSKRIAKATHELKKIELDIEKKRSIYEIFDDNLKKRYNALGEHIKRIQVYKDTLLSITNTIEDSLDTHTAIKALGDATTSLLICYEENGRYLQDKAMIAAHAAKSKAHLFSESIKLEFANRDYVNLTSEERIQFDRYINQFRDYEGVLRDEIIIILADVK